MYISGQDCRGNGGMCLIEICHRAGDVRDLVLTWGGVSAYTHQSPGVRPEFSETSALRYISTGWQTSTHSCQPFCCQSTLHNAKTEQKNRTSWTLWGQKYRRELKDGRKSEKACLIGLFVVPGMAVLMWALRFFINRYS